MINIKLHSDFCNSSLMATYWKNLLNNPETLSWNNLNIVNDESTPVDFHILLNKPNVKSKEFIDPLKTIILQNEPEVVRKDWGVWNNPDSNKVLQVCDITNFYSCTYWSIDKNYNWLINNNAFLKILQLQLP